MSIQPSNFEVVSSSPSFVEHMKRIQFFSWFPLSLSTTSFSKVSKLFLFISVLHFIVNLLHLWLPAISLRWSSNGPFSTVLSIVMKIAQSLIPAIFVLTALHRKSRFEETTKKFLVVLSTLGLWRCRMFLSCKIALGIYGIGISLLALLCVVAWLTGTEETASTIDLLLGFVYSTYLLAWDFQFFYTVRSIEACFVRLTQSTIMNKTNLKSFFQLYNRLIEISEEMNEFYDFPVSVVTLLFLLFFIDYTSILLAENNMSVADKFSLYFGAAMIAAVVMCILRNGQAASDQASRSNEALLKYLVHHKISENHDNSHLLIHLCAGQKLVFRACKSFPINYNLGLSMVAAYVTYTIVLVQIEHTPTSPKNSINATNLTLPKNE